MIVDEFTDESRVILNTKVEENEEDFAGKRGIVLIRSDVSSQTVSTVTDMLVIKCDSPGDLPYVVIATQKEVAEAGMRNIEFRVDKRDTKRVLMTSHQKYLMIFDRRKARRFIEQIRSGHLLIGRSRPINGKRIEFRIPIDGFDEVEHHLFEHCSRQRQKPPDVRPGVLYAVCVRGGRERSAVVTPSSTSGIRPDAGCAPAR